MAPGMVVPFAVGAPCLSFSALLMFLKEDVGGVSSTAHTTFGLPTAFTLMVPEPLAVEAPEWFGVVRVSAIQSPSTQVYSARYWAQKSD